MYCTCFWGCEIYWRNYIYYMKYLHTCKFTFNFYDLCVCMCAALSLENIESIKNPLEGVMAGLLDSSGQQLPLQAVHIKCKLIDLLSQVGVSFSFFFFFDDDFFLLFHPFYQEINHLLPAEFTGSCLKALAADFFPLSTCRSSFSNNTPTWALCP